MPLVEFLSISKATVFKDNSHLLAHCLGKSLLQTSWIHWQCQEQSTEQNLQPHFLSWKAQHRVVSGWGEPQIYLPPTLELSCVDYSCCHVAQLRVFWREPDLGSLATSTEFPHVLFCQIFLRLRPPSKSNSWSLGVTSPSTTGSKLFLRLHPEKKHNMGEGDALGCYCYSFSKGFVEILELCIMGASGTLMGKVQISL